MVLKSERKRGAGREGRGEGEREGGGRERGGEGERGRGEGEREGGVVHLKCPIKVKNSKTQEYMYSKYNVNCFIPINNRVREIT